MKPTGWPSWLTPAIPGVDNTGFDIIEEKADVVRLIFKLAAEGKGAKWIAGVLNKDEVPMLRPRGDATGGWNYQSIEHLLQSGAPIGLRDLDDEKFESVQCYPAIITTEIWTRANAHIGRNPSGQKTGANLLQGMLFCTCGSPLKFRNLKNRDPYVECTGVKKCLKGHPYFPLQALVIETAMSFTRIPDHVQRDLRDSNKKVRLWLSEWLGRVVAKVVVASETIEVFYRDGDSQQAHHARS